MNENQNNEAKIDRQLRTFFRREMPKTFPPFVAPTTTHPHQASSSLTWARCLIALSLVGFFALYMTLADSFSKVQPTTPATPLEAQPTIASTGKTAPKVEMIPLSPMPKAKKTN